MKTFKQYLMETVSIGKSMAGVNGVKYQADGGYIDLQVSGNPYAPRTQSVIDFVVDEDKRGTGVGKWLLRHAMIYNTDMGAQASSTASVKVFYNEGFRNPTMPTGSFADHERKRIEDSSVFMAMRDHEGKKYV